MDDILNAVSVLLLQSPILPHNISGEQYSDLNSNVAVLMSIG